MIENPVLPCDLFNRIAAIPGLEAIGVGSKLKFENDDDAVAFITALVAQGALQTYGIEAASQAEAEAGTEAGLRAFSPLRIAQAIDALVGELPPGPAGDDGAGYGGGISAVTILDSTESIEFQLNAGIETAYAVGSRVRLIYTGDATAFVEGLVTASAGSPQTLTVVIDYRSSAFGGGYSTTNWYVSIAGQPGETGEVGAGYDATVNDGYADLGAFTSVVTYNVPSAWAVGHRVRIGDETNNIEAHIVSFGEGTITFDVLLVNGTGAGPSSLPMYLIGEPGEDGGDGAAGTDGADGLGYAVTCGAANYPATGIMSWGAVTPGENAFTVGARIRAIDTSDPTGNWAEGVLTDTSGGNLVATIDRVGPAPALVSTWVFTIVGAPGADGEDGVVPFDTGWGTPASSGDKETSLSNFVVNDFTDTGAYPDFDSARTDFFTLSIQVNQLTDVVQALMTTLKSGLLPNPEV